MAKHQTTTGQLAPTGITGKYNKDQIAAQRAVSKPKPKPKKMTAVKK